MADGGVDVIVADNASSDDSLDVLASEFPSVGVIKLDRNYGFAEGYNRTLALLPHDYVVLLNSDVATPDGWLQPLVRLLDADPTVGACGLSSSTTRTTPSSNTPARLAASSTPSATPSAEAG